MKLYGSANKVDAIGYSSTNSNDESAIELGDGSDIPCRRFPGCICGLMLGSLTMIQC